MGGDPRDPPLGTGVGLASLAPELRKRPHHASSHRISSCYHFISFHLISFQFFSSHHISSHRMTPDIRQKCSQEQYLIRVCTFWSPGRTFRPWAERRKATFWAQTSAKSAHKNNIRFAYALVFVTWDDVSALGREAKSRMCLKLNVFQRLLNDW